MPLDDLSPVPRYLQVAAIIRGQIEQGELREGDTIPSREAIQLEYQVARDTAAKALRVLVQEGLVVVVPGRGARVARRSLRARMGKSAEQEDDDRREGGESQHLHGRSLHEAAELFPVHQQPGTVPPWLRQLLDAGTPGVLVRSLLILESCTPATIPATRVIRKTQPTTQAMKRTEFLVSRRYLSSGGSDCPGCPGCLWESGGLGLWGGCMVSMVRIIGRLEAGRHRGSLKGRLGVLTWTVRAKKNFAGDHSTILAGLFGQNRQLPLRVL